MYVSAFTCKRGICCLKIIWTNIYAMMFVKSSNQEEYYGVHQNKGTKFADGRRVYTGERQRVSGIEKIV